MPITKPLPLAARRAYRLALTVSLALAAGYGLNLPVPFLAPLMAVLLGGRPGPPPGARQTLGLVIVLTLSLGIGVLLGPLLQQAPVSALMIIALGVYMSNRIAILGGKELPATLLALGMTVIPAASTVSQALGSTIITALVANTVLAVLCQWLVYPLLPEDAGTPAPAPTALAGGSTWLALRATLIVLPAFLFTLTNPAAYLPLTVKSILLGREVTAPGLRQAVRELIGSTALGGGLAIAVWSCLSMAVNLWFYSAWILLFSLFLARGVYGLMQTRLLPSFWINTLTTMLILLGAAVQDSANGKDVYQAFFTRLALFLAVAAYAVLATVMLERVRSRRAHGTTGPTLETRESGQSPKTV